MKELSLASQLPEFDDHTMVSCVHDDEVGLHGYISIHRGSENYPSFGATRFWKYDSDLDALKDSLRLARTMSYKSAVANLPYGGAKAVIMSPNGNLKSKKNLIREYTRR